MNAISLFCRNFKPAPFLAGALLAGVLSTSAFGAVIVEDRFIDGGITNGADAQDVAWFVAATGGTLSVVSDNTTGPIEGGSNDSALNNNASASGFAAMAATFTAQTLTVGQTITLSFDARFVAVPSSNSGGFRFGLYNSNGGSTGTGTTGTDFGYLVRTVSGTAAGTPSIAEETGTSAAIFGGTDITTLGPGAFGALPAGLSTTTNKFSLAITRDSATQLSFVYSLNDVAITTTGGSILDTSGAFFTFDEIVIGTGNVTTNPQFRVDNVLVTVVPEPGAVLLLILGLGMFAVKRRRGLVSASEI